MKNKIAIIANGTINDSKFHLELLKDSDIIICADGGANSAKELGIIPNYVIGDLDSKTSLDKEEIVEREGETNLLYTSPGMVYNYEKNENERNILNINLPVAIFDAYFRLFCHHAT